jgi:succinate-acetate transporter protein
MSASPATETYDHMPKIENDGDIQHLERLRTAGGHVDDRSQPSLPVVHRSFANPAPLGLLSFATGIFLISILGVHARDIQTPNVLVGVLLFFGGVCQFISGIMEFVAGNTVSSTPITLTRWNVYLWFAVWSYRLSLLRGFQLLVRLDIYTRNRNSCMSV